MLPEQFQAVQCCTSMRIVTIIIYIHMDRFLRLEVKRSRSMTSTIWAMSWEEELKVSLTMPWTETLVSIH